MFAPLRPAPLPLPTENMAVLVRLDAILTNVPNAVVLIARLCNHTTIDRLGGRKLTLTAWVFTSHALRIIHGQWRRSNSRNATIRERK